ncbi:baseplate hub protein [Silvanigrella sp.]|uniref:baseplate hub protein n=1 Tax=Silvanigrella sp. TaxID=2024976 RepID=UPI0037C5268A
MNPLSIMPQQINRKAIVTVSPIMGGAGIVFDGLRITFDVQKTNEKKVQNKAKISIYNLSDESFNWFTKKNMAISLMVGWGENADNLLFYGEIVRALKEKKDADWIVNVESGDATKAYKNASVSKSYPEQTPHNAVFADATKELFKGNIIKGVKGIFATPNTFKKGFTAHGSATKVIDDILTINNYEWQIHNGILEIQKKGVSSNVVKLSSASGLIGSPEVTSTGIKATCLLQPEIAPMQKLYLDSIYLKGLYTPTKVTHTGDTHEGRWETTFETDERTIL